MSTATVIVVDPFDLLSPPECEWPDELTTAHTGQVRPPAQYVITGICGCISLTCEPCVQQIGRDIIVFDNLLGDGRCHVCDHKHVGSYRSCFKSIVPL